MQMVVTVDCRVHNLHRKKSKISVDCIVILSFFSSQVPWVEGPPFTMVVHPQYVGAILSLFGLGLVTITPWHADHGLWLMMFMQYGLYVATMYVEDKL